MKEPRLRFKGFDDEWKESNLGNLITYKKGYAFKSKDEVDKTSGIPLIKIGNLNEGKVDNNYNVYMPKSFKNKYPDNLLKDNDVLVTTVGSWANNMNSVVGKIYIYKYNGEDCLLNQNIVALKADNNLLNAYYLYSILLGQKFFQYIINLARGNANQASITLSDIFSYRFKLPLLPEQTKIGEFFNHFDKLIELQSSKLEHLKRLRRSHLQKMFTGGDAIVPRLRFKGFSDEWQNKQLSEVANIVMGQSPSSKNYTDSENYNILVQGNADLKNGHVVPRIYTKQITKQSDKNSIILTVRAPVGEVAINQLENVVIGRGVVSITGNRFIYDYLRYLPLLNYWKKLESGSTFSAVNSNDIKDIKLPYPSPAEQAEIGLFFAKLDKLIELQLSKLEYLKKLKKGYLQKMFI